MKYQILKQVTYLSTQYFITYSEDRLIILTEELLQPIQTLRNFTSSIKAVAASSNCGIIAVFCERQLITFKPAINGWFKSYEKNQENQIKDAYFSRDDQYLICCSDYQLNVWHVSYKEQEDKYLQKEIQNINEVFTLQTNQIIDNVKISPDVRFFSTKEEKIIKLWDFDSLNDQPFQLIQQNKIVSYKFRETFPCPPNSIAILTEDNIITFWQEQCVSAQKTQFLKLQSIYFENIWSFTFIKDREIQNEQSKVIRNTNLYGNLDKQPQSVDYMMIHQQDHLQLVKIDNLRNLSYKLSIQQQIYKNNRILRIIKKIVFSRNQNDLVSLYGFDQLGNIIRLELNLNNPEDFTIIEWEKQNFNKIELFSYDKGNDTVCIINDENWLIFQKACSFQTLHKDYEVKLISNEQKYYFMEQNMNRNIRLIYHEDQKVVLISNEMILLDLNDGSIIKKKQFPFEINQISILQTFKKGQLILVNDLNDIILLGIDLNKFEVSVIQKQNHQDQRILLDIHQSQLTYFVETNKKLIIYVDFQEQLTINIQDLNIKQAGILNENQLYLINQSNDIQFYSKYGQNMANFSLNKFLLSIDKSTYDINKLQITIFPLINGFILQIENYLIIMDLVYDKTLEHHVLQILKSNDTTLIARNQIYYKRLSRNTNSCQYFSRFNSSILIKTQNKIKILNNSFLKSYYNIEKNQLTQDLPSTIDLVQMNNHGIQTSFHDIEFLTELMNLGQFNTVAYILHKKDITLEELRNISTNQKIDNHFLQEILHEDRSNYVSEFLIYWQENQRSLDFFAAMYMFHVTQLRATRKKKGLGLKEIVWAMHSNQKETIWQECIDNAPDSWALVKRYGLVFWAPNLEVLKKKFEKITLSQYKESQNAFSVLLNYIILQKKTVIQMLMKKESQYNEQSKNTYNFLQNDFTQDRWKSAASKNAYALLSKKRYQDACAFFLLGGHIDDALQVMVSYMDDIQLAILCCKLYQAPLTKLIDTYFCGNWWLNHIGYVLKGEYGNAYNALSQKDFEQEKCQWTFEPSQSNFHPSILILLNQLKETILIKRLTESKDDDIFQSFMDEPAKPKFDLKVDLDYLKSEAMKYYYNTKNPRLAYLIEGQLNDQLNQQMKINEVFNNIKNIKELKQNECESILERLNSPSKLLTLNKDFQRFSQFCIEVD